MTAKTGLSTTEPKGCIQWKQTLILFLEKGRAVGNRLTYGGESMTAALWLAISSLFYSLQLQTGSFPKPLDTQEEQHYLALARQGNLEARNILIERNLRLVAHIMKKY